MKNKEKTFWLYFMEDDYSDRFNVIKGNRESRTLELLYDISNDEFAKLILEDCSMAVLSDDIILPFPIFNMLFEKLEGKKLRQASLTKQKKPKELINVITYKNNKYYQLMIDINNFTYELGKYDVLGDCVNYYYLDDFVFDLLIRALIESRYISYSKKIYSEVALEGIRGNLDERDLAMLSSNYFEDENYYDFEVLISQIKRFYNQEITLDYFVLWSKFVCRALKFNQETLYKNNIYFEYIVNLFNIDNDCKEVEDYSLLAKLKYLDFKMHHPEKECSDDEVVRYVSLNEYEEENYYDFLVIDYKNNKYNYQRHINLVFDKNKNYNFVEYSHNLNYIDYYDYSNLNILDIYYQIFMKISKNKYQLDNTLI